jgi:prepilin-type processing-associated H-X9-DG protein
MYSATNFSLNAGDPSNLTIGGVLVNSLVCPSDLQNQSVVLNPTQSQTTTPPGWSWYNIYPLPPGNWTQAFSSYGGNAGSFTFGFCNLMEPTIFTQHNGTIYNDSSVTIASVTDGTSNTFLFGERAKGRMFVIDPYYCISDSQWNVGRYFDTLVSALYPINLSISLNNLTAFNLYNYYAPTSAGSFHPGGANFGLCDGSVRFIKNSISSWPFNTGNNDGDGDAIPDNTTRVTLTATAPYSRTGYYLQNSLNGINAQLGVYQQLSTRNGGEIVSSDSY